MAYNAISPGEIDPDSPITTDLMTKLRDNPEAIAQGLTGATRISHSAGEAYIAGNSRLVSFNAGAGQYLVSSGAYQKVAKCIVEKSGTVNIDFEVCGVVFQNYNYPGYGRVYIDGVAVGSEFSKSGPGYARSTTETISVSVGEELQFMLKNGFGSTNVGMRNIRVQSDFGFPFFIGAA